MRPHTVREHDQELPHYGLTRPRDAGSCATVRFVNLFSISLPLAAALGSLLVEVPTMAQSLPRTPVDVSKLGPQVGERVPDFNLKDQNGKSWTLQSIMGPKGAMLVFFRSADW